jgi:phenylpropionate dioxygenase-like ring-hydroxylating dioxygenase large terminal subunit
MTWTLLAHRSELSQRGDFVNLPSGTVAYNHAVEPVSWSGLCPHRGTRLFTEPAGNQKLVCPYHGWSEKLILAGIERRLTAWVGDWLFSGTGESRLEDDLGPLHELLSLISSRIASRADFMSFPVNADWRVSVENALEDVHVPHVHPESIGKLGLESEGMERFGRNSIGYYKITDKRTLAGLAAIAPHVEQCEPSKYFHILVYPWTCISSVGGLSYTVTQYFPSEHGTTVWSRLYAPRGTTDMKSFLDIAAAFNRKVFQEDRWICERVSGQGTVLMEAERRIRWFRAAA